jgi:Lar family restriction alleviation protein
MTDIERLRAWAAELPDEISSWGAYADEYFQQKWKLAEAIETAKANSAEMLNLLADYERLRGMEERVKGAVALRDCPFCGGNQPVAQEVPISHEHKWIVICNCCGVRTDHCVTEKVAVSLWNSRNGELVPVPGGEGK